MLSTFCVCICTKQISMLSSVNINPARTNHRPIIHAKTSWIHRYIIQYKTNLDTYTIVSYHPSPALPFLPRSNPSKPWDCVIVNHHTFWNIWQTSIICRIWQETTTHQCCSQNEGHHQTTFRMRSPPSPWCVRRIETLCWIKNCRKVSRLEGISNKQAQNSEYFFEIIVCKLNSWS